jgi:predicted membrane protein
MGKCVVDLRQAQLDAPDIVVTAVALMGDVQVIVPDGVDVELTGFALMGNKRDRTRDAERVPGAPRIRVHAFVLMGEAAVRSR